MTTKEYAAGVYCVVAPENIEGLTREGWEIVEAFDTDDTCTLVVETPLTAEEIAAARNYGGTHQQITVDGFIRNVTPGNRGRVQQAIRSIRRYLLRLNLTGSLAQAHEQLMAVRGELAEHQQKSYAAGVELAKVTKERDELNVRRVSNEGELKTLREARANERETMRRYERDMAKLRKALGELQFKKITEEP